MARRVPDAVLETRNARRRLKAQGKPYWKALIKGLHLGYRKYATGSTWVARRLNDKGRYEEQRLGACDDFQDADGLAVFDYGQAQEKARAWFKKAIRVDAGLEEVESGTYTVAKVMQDYRKHYALEGKGLVTVDSAMNAHILPTLGDIEVVRLTTKKITDWHRELAAKPAQLRTSKMAKKRQYRIMDKSQDGQRERKATANRVLTVLKAALNYAWREGRVESDTAWRKVKPFKNVTSAVVRYLSEAECVRLSNVCATDFRNLLNGALFTGCRYGELISLKVSDFNPDAGTLHVRVSKSGNMRHVVLTDEAKTFFESVTAGRSGGQLIFTHEDGGAWKKSHQFRLMKEACGKAKITPAIGFHVLRHTHGSILAMRGVPMPVIAKQLGHADTRMTERHYAHLSPSYVSDTIRQNFPRLGIQAESNVKALKKVSH